MCEKQNCAAEDALCAAGCDCGSGETTKGDAQRKKTRCQVLTPSNDVCEARGNCIHNYKPTPFGTQVGSNAEGEDVAVINVPDCAVGAAQLLAEWAVEHDECP